MLLDKKKLVRGFTIRSIIFLIGWKVVFHGLIVPTGSINNYLTSNVAYLTAKSGEIFGYSSRVEVVNDELEPNHVNGIVYFDNEPALKVADSCNGLELFALYIGFIVCFPGSVKWKFIFSVCGTLLLFLLNVLREFVLAINYLYFRSTFDFNHKYTYAIAVYLVVFLIWRFWLNRFSAIKLVRK